MNIVIPVYHHYKSGGMRVLCNLANEWSRAKHAVILLICDSSSQYFPVDSTVTQIKLGRKSYITKLCSTIRFLVSHFSGIDCILANQNLTAGCVWLSCLLGHNLSKGFYYIQAYEPDFYTSKTVKDKVKRRVAQFSYDLPLEKIVNADLYRNYKNIRTDKVVYPGLDLKLYNSKDVELFNETIRVGTIGRTEEWKGTADVCRAMEILQSENVNFEFFIAFNDFETIPHHFVRPDGDENLAAFYRDMDIVVAACKGQHGAIHYPVIETMAVGSTIVCTDYYPANESNAYVVDEDSPEQIAAAIKGVLRDRDTAIRKRRQALVDVRQFDWPIVAEKFLGYLSEANGRAAQE